MRDKNKQHLYLKEWKKRNKDKIRKYAKTYIEKHRKKLREYKRSWCAKNRDHVNAKARIYGAKRKEAAAEYQQMQYKEQPLKMREKGRRSRKLPKPSHPESGVCECCGNPPNKKFGLHLDHDHKTGQFRGWLCHKCNLGLGSLGDDEMGVARALVYLGRANDRNISLLPVSASI